MATAPTVTLLGLLALLTSPTPSAPPTLGPVAGPVALDWPRPPAPPTWDADAAAYPAVALHRITAYNAHASQTDSTPTVASCGPLSAAPGRVIAVSRDLLYTPDGRKRCGQEIAIEYADGRIITGVIWDTMNRRYRGAADVLMPTYEQARQHGVQAGHLIMLD